MSLSNGRQPRLRVIGHLLRSVAAAAVLTGLYYLAPLDRGVGVGTVVLLLTGLAVFGALIAWQLAAIARSEYPRLRAIEAMATAVPLFLVLFAAVYFLISKEYPATFSEPMNRTDALYFTVTVFATVGFGDIAPVSEAARALTTVQMVADLIVVGLVAKGLFGAVQVGLLRKGTDGGPEEPS
ncbi:potassium channel family protein [Streptomyces sp. NBC_01351]|uniref:potassium channel family protein n=1 Tax=Streptomyces sp. NBC_01351 TaxID=2903833 RepID=UPI002E351061|nr:potassium channel family protein [Streptomyces sp. NBC_01351]